MKTDTLPLLSCLAPRRSTSSAKKTESKKQACGGNIVRRDKLTLMCQRCGTEYPVRAGVPRLSLTELAAGRYSEDTRLQDYYEMHYAPYLDEADLTARLCFPQPGTISPSRDDSSAERFAEARQSREASSEHALQFCESVDVLSSYHDLTEEFYQCILELCRPLVGENTVALDVGCGLGRMTIELARLGARMAIGLDSSARMVEEAARFATSKDDIPVRLNLAGGKTVTTIARLSWPEENCSFLVGDAQQLAFRDEVFDVAICLNLIDRVPEPTRVVDELLRVLKPGGRLIISDPYDWDERTTERRHWVSDMADLFDNRKWERVREIDGIPFALRSGSNRHISIYLNHCFIYGKVGYSKVGRAS